ncbi:tail assembly chaperone [Lysinibacillus sp. CTST325]
MSTKAEAMKDEGVKITLGNKKFEVRFDLNALCNLQDKFGDFTKAFDGLEKQDFKKIRSLLHVGLANGENINITEADVGALIDMKNITTVTDALTQAFGDAMPSTDEEGK